MRSLDPNEQSSPSSRHRHPSKTSPASAVSAKQALRSSASTSRLRKTPPAPTTGPDPSSSPATPTTSTSTSTSTAATTTTATATALPRQPLLLKRDPNQHNAQRLIRKKQQQKPSPTTITATSTPDNTASTSRPTPPTPPPAPIIPRIVTTRPMKSSVPGPFSRNMAPGSGDSTNSSSSSSNSNSNNNRPRQPQLSAASLRAANRPPLTPKVAASSKPPTPSLVSPHGGPRRLTASKDDRSTSCSPSPFPPGIAPRRGPRPDHGFDTPSSSSRSALGISSSASLTSQPDGPDAKFFYASAAPAPRPSSHQPPPREPQQHQQPLRPVSVPQRPSNFFHANGLPVDGRRTTSPPTGSPNPSLTPVLAATPAPTSTKFFYADGKPDYTSRPSPPPPPPPLQQQQQQQQVNTSGSASTLSASSRAPNSTSRPISPVRAASTLSASPSLQTASSAQTATRPQATSPPYLTPAANVGGIRRRVSVERPARELSSPSAGPRSRNGSMISNIEQNAIPLPLQQLQPPHSPQSPRSVLSASPPLSPGLSPGLSQPVVSMASLLQAAEDLEEGGGEDEDGEDGSVRHGDAGADSNAEEGPSDGDVIPSGTQSPTKSAHSSNDAVSELVANARRERKVQDLEIRNASLEAINRTLERQLRRQTAELRRYRRLSRSGRLSAVSSRVTSAALTEPPTDLSDLSEADETLDIDRSLSLHGSDLSPSDDDRSMDDGESADGRADEEAHMAARRKRDEMRLQLDLSKHQELLVDSQRLNTSIKRCLDWTEVLIKEGNRALRYHVRVSDVELGGHILPPPDDDADVYVDADVDADVDDDASSPPGDDASTVHIPAAEKTPPDRDSGVELPVDA
ncbi:hypothetical protein GMORB2_3773 [Geosmithia morbida]|uniref:Uncharacterized protein n=1 Tax=Geosmithia morbida TaxID=1094350 RepID=A0A9P4Z1J1_9HYPO|nr:uncharacterized protein GMORB2_3773 [Geosmithia morbida]KAF4124934.1 hypothetical protein GMORB2_3773 [Geosmithia morbida]